MKFDRILAFVASALITTFFALTIAYASSFN
jgi:hypothetical protein